MNNKGFTLIELLSVLVVLGVILLLVFPAVNNIIDTSNETVYDVQIKKILNSAYDYTLKNIELLPINEEDTYYVTLNELKKYGFIESDIASSTTKNEFSNDLVISVKKVKAGYQYNKGYSVLQGNYLYTVELEKMNTEEFKVNRPIITITTPSLIEVDIGNSYVHPEYSATDINGNDLTEKVIENITYNSKNVSEIDTNKTGIYYINYSVVDINGYSNELIVSVVIGDKEPPILVIPDDVTISSSVTNFDLKEGVSCGDNSGINNCTVKIVGEIKYGVVGKYIIEYIATDPSGNTTTLRRVITIE